MQGNIEYLSDSQENLLIQRAQDQGLIEGDESIGSKLHENITRAEMAKLVTLYVQQYEKEKQKNLVNKIMIRRVHE